MFSTRFPTSMSENASHTNSSSLNQVCFAFTIHSIMRPTGSPGNTLKAMRPRINSRRRSKAYRSRAHLIPTYAPTRPRITTVLASQGTSVVRNEARKRSRCISMILHAIQPGTQNPYPNMIGMNALPCKPILCMTESI